MDVVITGPAEYIVINTLTEATPLVGFGRPDYRCAVVVRADAGIDSIANLKGTTVAFGDLGSTSNMLCPMQLMADYGLCCMDRVKVSDPLSPGTVSRQAA